MVDENTSMPDEPTEPKPAEPAEPTYEPRGEGVDAPEPVDLEPPAMPEPEPVAAPSMPEPTFEQAPPPPPPPGPSPQYTPPPPPPPSQTPGMASSAEKNKIVAGLLAIFLGEFGIHKFYLGYNKEGLILLLVTVLSFGILSWATWIVGIIEGIIYITKTDQEFYQTYVVGRKPWF
jgi:TM2 domain-containing membrane protein YozV